MTTAGVMATLPLHLGPKWYPTSLVLIALPGSGLEGLLYRGGRASR